MKRYDSMAALTLRLSVAASCLGDKHRITKLLHTDAAKAIDELSDRVAELECAAQAEAAALREDAERWRRLLFAASEENESNEFGIREPLGSMVRTYLDYQSPIDRGYAQQEEGMRLALLSAIDQARKA